MTVEDTEAAQSIGVVMTGPIGDRITRAVQAHNMAARLAVEAGYLLLGIKAESAHGEFERGIEAMGLSRQRAAELMTTAKFVTSLPAAQRAELLMLPKTKVLALASADPEVLIDLLDMPDADLCNLSVRALRARIKELEEEAGKRTKRLEAELEHRDAVIQKLKKKDVQRDFDPLTHMVRDECLAYQAGVEINLQSLSALFDEVVADDPQAPEWTLRLEQIWFATHAAAARVTALLDKVRTTMPRQMPQQAATPNMLTPDEVMHWTLEWETMVSQAKVSAATRADLRAQEGPRGVGRPKGAKTGAKLDGKANKA
ncbi:hypothetical protein [Rhodoferax sp. BLA1]|uniref:hypothetical protein n=1 Tax=Rhodoferax sp. BLA1 TaxID=2576062 RepID=UPI0015D44E7C|nr:hypothetical protein [Rhodoferax sp. BLA1]